MNSRHVPSVAALQCGSVVYSKGKEFIITHVLDLQSLLAKEVDSGKVERLEIADVSPVLLQDEKPSRVDLEHYSDRDWRIAQERFEIIRPLLKDPHRTRASVAERARQFGKHTNTLYGWIRLYEECGTLTVLMQQKRNDKGSTKVSAEVEIIIQKAIEEEYLTDQQKSPVKVHQTVQKLCKAAGLTAPHCNTVRNRINALPEHLKIYRRRGRSEARDRFSPTLGSFPGADYPYALIQIDHTPLDIITVDDVHRLPLDRPYLTLAIDVCSRMVVGFYLSYDPPGAISTGLCLSQAILPKNALLAAMDISTPWPCWGIPKTVHADNAKEFRGKMLDRACDQYGINLEWRPVATPHFGGHIERLLGTVATELKTLPGTTFSNVSQRGQYDSTKKSALTLSELEKWLCIYFTEVYHQRLHTGIGCSPMKRFEQGIFGSAATKGSGLPPRVVDEDKLKLDFLPFVERTVQDYGILIDGIFYFNDVLRPWVNCTVPGKSKLKRKFIVRYDPRDLSQVWFFDPQLESYFEIPYRDTGHPVISAWELRQVRKKLLEEGRKDIDEDLIFSAYEKMNEIKDQAQALTKKHRKQTQRKKKSAAAPRLGSGRNAVRKLEPPVSGDAIDGHVESREGVYIEPFDEMEDL